MGMVGAPPATVTVPDKEDWGQQRPPGGTDEEPASNLRSAREVEGYHIQASDGEFGHVDDFLVDEADWTIRYLIVDTRNWLPGKKVLTPPENIDRITWDERKVYYDVTQEKIKNSPEYIEGEPVRREYEEELRDYFGWSKYWL